MMPCRHCTHPAICESHGCGNELIPAPKSADEVAAAFVRGMPQLTASAGSKSPLSQRLSDEADMCRNDGADDIARLLDEAARELAAWDRLRNPQHLHANLLRGIPARLTPEMLRHLAGVDELLAAERERCASTPIDYPAAIKWCFEHLGHAQGTKGCIAFARGAEWALRQLKA